MSLHMNRQQRRQLPKAALPKQILQNPNQTKSEEYASITQLSTIVKDLQTVFNHSKSVNNNVWFLIDTLARKGLITWDDYHETENLYKQREEKKQIRVKELLEQDLSIEEALQAVEETKFLLGYERLNIHPVKDLNINPNELAFYIKSTNPDKTKEEYLELGRKWQLTDVHFGFRKPDEALI